MRVGLGPTVTASPLSPPTHVAVSVVLPVRNEGAHIDAVLKDVLAQEPPVGGFEVLVVDGESSDDTASRARRHAALDARVRVLNNPGRLSSRARALGAAEARGTYVAFVDGHCRLPSRTLLVDMCALFERTGADCLARPQPLVPAGEGSRGQPAMARAIAAARSSRLGHSTASTIYDESERAVSPVSAGAMYRREVFERVGTFDPTFDACEDVEFNWRVERAGLACWTSPVLAVLYEPRRHLGGLYRQMLRYGLGRARLHRKHPRAFTWESLVPAAFVLGLLPLALSPWLPLALRALVAAPYALYALSLALCSLATAARKGWDLLPLLPLVFPVIHIGLGVGYLKGWITRRPTLAPEVARV